MENREKQKLSWRFDGRRGAERIRYLAKKEGVPYSSLVMGKDGKSLIVDPKYRAEMAKAFDYERTWKHALHSSGEERAEAIRELHAHGLRNRKKEE